MDPIKIPSVYIKIIILYALVQYRNKESLSAVIETKVIIRYFLDYFIK